MSAYLIDTDGRPLKQVQAKLQKYLPGPDVRLFPLSETRAVLRGHLLDALATEYTAPREVWLTTLGIQNLQPFSDEQVLGALQGRDLTHLPARAGAAPPRPHGLDWHLHTVNVRPAWARLGGPDHIDWGTTKVAQLDTGYTRHPAFGFPGASWVDVAGGQTDVPPPQNAHDQFLPAEPGGGLDPMWGFNRGHGTRIGATICGWHPQAAGGAFYGVAPKVPYLPMRITDAVLINHAQLEFARALDHAVTLGQARVVNVSLGIFPSAQLLERQLRQALNRAYEAGVIVVCAAGNIVDPVVAPARLSRTLAVAGVTRERRPWSGSSFGPEVDLSAPAADLRRADAVSPTQFRYGGGGDGTSYATALTSGAAALWLTYRRAELATYSQPWCVVEAFKKLVRDTAQVPPGWRVNSGFGAGVLDIGRLLAAALPPEHALDKAPAA